MSAEPKENHPLVEDYLQANADIILAPMTVDAYRSRLSTYTTYLDDQDRSILDAEKEDVVGFIEEGVRNGNRQSTLRTKLSTIIEFYKHIRLRTDAGSELSLDPLELETIDVGKYRTPDELQRVALSREEVRKLFDAMSSYRNRLFVGTGVETGLRNSDLRELKIEDADFENETLHVRSPKGNSPYDVPISNDLVFELDYWIQEYRPAYGGSTDSSFLFPGQTSAKLETNGSLNGIVKKAAERAGIQDVIGTSELADGQREALNTQKREREWSRVTVHTLRHTYITLLQQAGIPIAYRQHVANHRNPNTTRGYSHGPESIFEVIREKFDPPR